MEREIEALCTKLLLKQQPVAADLRRITAALKMVTDLERIGDQASDIAEPVSYTHLEDRPMSAVPLTTASMPAPEPVAS